MARNNDKGSDRLQIEGDGRFRAALDAMGDGIWDWNIQTGEVFYSDRWLESLGYHRNDATPDLSFVGGIVHPEDGDVLSKVGTRDCTAPRMDLR